RRGSNHWCRLSDCRKLGVRCRAVPKDRRGVTSERLHGLRNRLIQIRLHHRQPIVHTAEIPVVSRRRIIDVPIRRWGDIRPDIHEQERVVSSPSISSSPASRARVPIHITKTVSTPISRGRTPVPHLVLI